MTTPNERYERPHEKLGRIDMLKGCSFDHLSDAVQDSWLDDIEPPHVEVRILKGFNFACRRFWRLATVWFDGKPVMVADVRATIIASASLRMSRCSERCALTSSYPTPILF